MSKGTRASALEEKAMLQEKSADKHSVNEVRVSFSGEAYEILEDIARRKNKPIEDVVEDALGLERWYQEIREQGGRVIIERKDGSVTELVRD
jgi:hypothetical protein